MEIALIILNVIVLIGIITLFAFVKKSGNKGVKADNNDVLDRLNNIENTLRMDIANSTNATNSNSIKAISSIGDNIHNSVKTISEYQNKVIFELNENFKKSVEDNANMQYDYQKEIIGLFNAESKRNIEYERALRQELDRKLNELNTQTTNKLNEINTTTSTKLTEINDNTNAKLREVKEVVDEKLTKTINERFNASFDIVVKSLENINNGFKEMQELSLGVTDLNKMLNGVKTRGVWGENSLENILEEILIPEQYARNVNIKDNNLVDFAVMLPGKNNDKIYLPMDAKFPIEDYLRLVNANESCDREAVAREVKNLENAVKKQAKSIATKYIQPPKTTDFAIMYVPTESLYAEILKINGLTESIQRECRVVIVGPSTVTALLNSLQLGFKTLAIQKSSAEIWKMFVQFRKDFGMFTDLLEKAQKKIDEANTTIENATKRTSIIRKRLDKVEQIAMPDEDMAILED